MYKDKADVTIVVPVYNVEKYLDKCICSILNQSYKDYNIILVDDGSTDNSGRICDNYAKQYSNIVVLHKNNGGLSDARNYSYGFINTEYVMFVDADDYVDNNYIECAVRALKEYNADIAAVGVIFETEDNMLTDSIEASGTIYEMNTSEAINELCYNKRINTSAVGKVFRTESVKRHLFPKGKLYEGLATVYKLIGEANKVIAIDAKPYHYVQREGSIRHRKWRDSFFDVIDATEQLKEYVMKCFPQSVNAINYRFFLSSKEVYVRAMGEAAYLAMINNIMVILKRHWRDVMGDIRVSFKDKIQYTLMAYFPRTYRFVYISAINWRRG